MDKEEKEGGKKGRHNHKVKEITQKQTAIWKCFLVSTRREESSGVFLIYFCKKAVTLCTISAHSFLFVVNDDDKVSQFKATYEHSKFLIQTDDKAL